MFRSAALKLTLWYLAIIMALSVSLSLALYYVSAAQLSSNARRPADLYSLLFGPDQSQNVRELNDRQLQKDKNSLKFNLLLFNLGVLAVGGGVSYWLARRTLKPIEETLEMQKRFTGDASHELRTPLTAMQTEIEVALRNSSLTKADAVQQLKSNLEEVGRLRSLSEGLLALATITGKGVQREPVSLRDVAAEATQQVSKLARHRHIKIKKVGKDVRVLGNRQQMLNLLSILLDNAVKYSPRGGEVIIELKRDDKQAVVTVTDFGQGIAPQDIPRIFERFYRADTSRTKNTSHGYGLGLAIAEKIVLSHKGSIGVASSLGKGSSFTVRLPLAQ